MPQNKFVFLTQIKQKITQFRNLKKNFMGNIIFNTKFTLLLKIIFFLLSISVIYSCKITLKGSKPISLPSNNIKTDSMAADVKAQMLHCWNTYKKYAWGHDEVRPLAMSSKNYYNEPLMLTPISAYSTFRMMGLDQEAAECKELIMSRLNFDRDITVNHAEVVHVVLGGLLNAYEADNDEQWLDMAADLGNRLIPAFNAPWGLCYRQVNLKTGTTSGDICTPNEIGGMLMEYGTLSKYTGDAKYFDIAMKGTKSLYNRKSKINLLGSAMDVRSGTWTNPESNIMEGSDIWIDDLYKAAVLFNNAELYAMFTTNITAIIKYLREYTESGTWYENGNMNYGTQVNPEFSAQSCSFPALLMLYGNKTEADLVFESVIRYWSEYGMAPELMNYKSKQVISASYLLRPQPLLSAAVLNKYGNKSRYLQAGNYFYTQLVKFCRNDDNGFVALRDVRTLEKMDQLDYYFFGATLKYAYMLYNSEAARYLDTHVFNASGMMFKKPSNE